MQEQALYTCTLYVYNVHVHVHCTLYVLISAHLIERAFSFRSAFLVFGSGCRARSVRSIVGLEEKVHSIIIDTALFRRAPSSVRRPLLREGGREGASERVCVSE